VWCVDIKSQCTFTDAIGFHDFMGQRYIRDSAFRSRQFGSVGKYHTVVLFAL
jgi:hypothetical protein